MKKRLLATLLAVCLLVGMLPMAASAEGTGTTVTTATLHDTKNIVSNEDLYTPNSYNITSEGSKTSDNAGSYTEYNITVSNLKQHYNAQQPEVLGYWIGATFTAPADAGVAKVRFTHTSDPNGIVDGSIAIKDYDVTAIQNSIETTKLSFYNNLDASNATARRSLLPLLTANPWRRSRSPPNPVRPRSLPT